MECELCCYRIFSRQYKFEPWLSVMFIEMCLFSQESESEEDVLDEGDDDDDLEEEHETQVHPEAEPEVKKAPEVPAPPKEAERQLSKKERKQKEQAEFEALSSRFFGVAPNNGQGNCQGIYHTILLYIIHASLRNLITQICSTLALLLLAEKITG